MNMPEVTVAKGKPVCLWIKLEMKYSSHPIVFSACTYRTARAKGGGSQNELQESIANPKQNPIAPQNKHTTSHVSVGNWMVTPQATRGPLQALGISAGGGPSVCDFQSWSCKVSTILLMHSAFVRGVCSHS